jgi:putative glutamine amidotransferase
MIVSMAGEKPIRLGVPWRTLEEEHAGRRGNYSNYLRAIEAAGGTPVEISLSLPRQKLDLLAASLDAFVLPGSPADVDPQWYHAPRHAMCANADRRREETDFAVLDHAFAQRKPVLAICYGVQSLNVYLGGTLIQDLASLWDAPLKHDRDRERGEADPRHLIRIEARTELARLAGEAEVEVNSSHHQAIDRPGRGLRVTAHAPDGVIEAVERTGDKPEIPTGHWVVGVQWHPERLPGDKLTHALFAGLLAASRRVASRP